MAWLMGMCVPGASAQGVASGVSGASAQRVASAQDVADYSRLSVSLVSAQPVSSGGGVPLVSNHSLRGVGASYLMGFNVCGRRLPLFVEVGPECSYVRNTDDIDYWDEDVLVLHDEVSTKLLWLGSPINLTYLHRLTDNVALAPSAGLNVKVNLLAEVSSLGVDEDCFDHDAHRVQLGCNAGCGLYLDRFYLGLRYRADVTPFMAQGGKKERYQDFSLSVGVRF